MRLGVPKTKLAKVEDEDEQLMTRGKCNLSFY